MPDIEKYYQLHHDKVNVITISGDPADDILAIMKQKNLSFPVLYDEKGAVFARYGVRAIPMTFLINHRGQVIKKLPGAVTNQDLEKYLP